MESWNTYPTRKDHRKGPGRGHPKDDEFLCLCFECGIIGGGGREDSILIHKATSAVFLLD